MSVYRPKRSPHYHYDFVFRGQRFYGSTGCSSRREAEAYERNRRHEAANPVSQKPVITVDEACGLYQEHAERLNSWPTTRYMLAALVSGLGARKLLSEVTQRDLETYFAKRRNGRSNATINREIDNARAVWWRASRSRFEVGEMPNWKALYLRVAQQVPRELSESTEQDPLFAALPDDVYDVVMFALLSGWRRNEVIGLRWTDVDLGRAEAITTIKGGNGVVRHLDSVLVLLIARQPKVGPFVFTYECRKSRAKRRKGERYPMTAGALRTRWSEAKKAAKIASFRFHDLRHTAATRILRATQNLALTKDALKHTNISTTLRYAHVLGDDVRKGISAAQSRTIPELVKRRGRKG